MLVLLQAYAMYRLNKLQDALDVLAGNLPDTPGKALLEAQLHHRLGNYAAAIATYNKLVQQHKVSFCFNLVDSFTAKVFSSSPGVFWGECMKGETSWGRGGAAGRSCLHEAMMY